MIDHIGIGASDFAASKAFYAAALAPPARLRAKAAVTRKANVLRMIWSPF